jgi:hypothetical protein
LAWRARPGRDCEQSGPDPLPVPPGPRRPNSRGDHNGRDQSDDRSHDHVAGSALHQPLPGVPMRRLTIHRPAHRSCVRVVTCSSHSRPSSARTEHDLWSEADVTADLV